MKKFLRTISIFMVTALMFSCDKTAPDTGANKGEEGKGKIQLRLSTDDNMIVKSGVASDLQVIIKDSTGKEVFIFNKASEIPEIIELDVATYTVEATSGVMLPVAWDTPHYYGVTEFTVDPYNVTAINVVSDIDNAKISMKYTERFKTYFGSDFSITLVTDGNANDPLVFSSTEVRSAFVKPTRTELRFESTKIPGFIKVLDVIKPKDHHIITYDIKETGESSLSVTINSETNDINMDIDIPTSGEDLGNGGELPDGGGTSPVTKVTIVGDGFDIDQPIVLATGTTQTVSVTIEAEAGIKNLIVDICSPELSEEILNSTIGAKRFDMADLNPTLTTNLIDLGLLGDGDVVKGAKSFKFDIIPFVALLSPNDITHDFVLELTDANGNSVTKTLSLKRVE